MDDARTLLELELDTLWITDERGRLLRARTPELRRPPALVAATAAHRDGDGDVLWRCSANLADDVVARVDGVLTRAVRRAEHPHVGWRPSCAGLLLDELARVVRVEREERGPSYVVRAAPRVVAGVECWTSTDIDPERLTGRMPEHDRRTLCDPWVVAIVAGHVAAVCETARSAPRSVEAGVWTYQQYRRRGLGAAVTAAWSQLVADRTMFYSTSCDNISSQGIARRLGLTELGQWWSVHVQLR